MKNKIFHDKFGSSEILTTLLLILLSLAIFVIVFNVTNSLIKDKAETTQACFGNYGKITIENKNTCHNSTSEELQFLISVGDIEIDSLFVSVSGEGGIQSFEIKNEVMNNLREYGSAYNSVVDVPASNSGKKYFFNTAGLNLGNINSITVAPVISEVQCEVSDSLYDVSDCRVFE